MAKDTIKPNNNDSSQKQEDEDVKRNESDMKN